MPSTQEGTSQAHDTGLPSRIEDAPGAPVGLSTESLYSGPTWGLQQDAFTYAGSTHQSVYLNHPGSVAIVALDDTDRVLLINQYRPAVRYREWEIPAGTLDIPGEDPLRAAQRELAEEADAAAREWKLLAEFYTTPGCSSEAMRIFLARGIVSVESGYTREGFEAGIKTAWVPIAEVVDGILTRRLYNSSLVVGVMAAHIALASGGGTLSDADEPWTRRPRVATT